MTLTGKHLKLLKGCIKMLFCVVVFRTYIQVKEVRQLSEASTDLQRDEHDPGLNKEEDKLSNPFTEGTYKYFSIFEQLI